MALEGRHATPIPPPDVAVRLSRVTIRAWLICGAAVLVLSTLLSAAVALAERRAVVAAQAQLHERLRPAQNAASELARAYVDQETGQRGFVWTGEPVFLEPFESGREHSAELERRLGVLIGSDPEARRRLEAVQAAGVLWQQRSANPDIAARRSGTFDPSEALATATEGKALFDQLRQRLSELSQRVDQLTEQQVAAMAWAQHRANVGTALGALVAMLTAVAIVVAVHRTTTRPLARLVTELTEVSGGATERRITVAGPAELASIATAAEKMRTSLVSNAEALASAQRQLGAFDERDRMAAQMRDSTIQRLFSLSLSLSQLIGSRPELAAQAAPLVKETDVIARELRSIIYPDRLEPTDQPDPAPPAVSALR